MRSHAEETGMSVSPKLPSMEPPLLVSAEEIMPELVTCTRMVPLPFAQKLTITVPPPGKVRPPQRARSI